VPHMRSSEEQRSEEKRLAPRNARGGVDGRSGKPPDNDKMSKTSNTLTASAAARARKIRVLLMDVDGVLTDGHVYLQSFPDGSVHEAKAFHSQDGAGLKLAHDAGLRTGVITGRKSAAVVRRAKEVGMEFVYQGYAEKIPAYEEILRRAGVPEEEVAYIGDDLPDLPVMQRAGLAIAVANAVIEVRRGAHYVTQRSGGDAGVREAIEQILKAQGKWAVVWKHARA
jgi:3-deoxy-D-manno-octulosonate 8-phosphate phosphatase (KDO 8-P phosphatase)